MLLIVPYYHSKSGDIEGVKMPHITVKEYADRTPRKSKLGGEGHEFSCARSFQNTSKTVAIGKG
jgi:hypothetical protein